MDKELYKLQRKYQREASVLLCERDTKLQKTPCNLLFFEFNQRLRVGYRNFFFQKNIEVFCAIKSY